MIKKLIYLASLLLCPFCLQAQSLAQAEKLFAEGDFASAKQQYQTLLQTSEGDSLYQAQLRLTACQYHLGEFLEAAKHLYAYPLPNDNLWKSRFLFYRIHLANQLALGYRAVLPQDKISSSANTENINSWTPEQFQAQALRDYETLWNLRAALIQFPTAGENLILNLENADLRRIPTLFDFLVHNWKTFLLRFPQTITQTEPENSLFLEGSARLLEGPEKPAFQKLASLLETAYLLDGKNRQEAKMFWKADFILLPFQHKENVFKIESPQKALRTATAQLNLLGGYTAEDSSWWKKLKGYVAPAKTLDYARGYVLHQTAQLLFENNQAPEALSVCKYATEKLEASGFVQDCQRLSDQITQPYLQIDAQKESFNRTKGVLSLTGRNLQTAYLNLYKTSKQELASLKKKTPFVTLNSWDFLDSIAPQDLQKFLSQTPMHHMQVSVPFREVYAEQKASFNLPELSPGFYVVLISAKENFNPQEAAVFSLVLNATDLALFVSEGIEDDPARYIPQLDAPPHTYHPHVFHTYTLNLQTGLPEGNTQLDMITEWKGTRQTAQTNLQGTASFARPVTVGENAKNTSFMLHALAEKRGSYAYASPQLHFAFYNEAPVRLFIQTDRPVYRPEQKVQISVNAFEKLPRGLKTLGGKTTQIILTDPNGKKLFSTAPVANTLGTSQAEFVLPKDGLLGQYSIQASLKTAQRTYTAHAYFRVEEYKRPEYEITLSQPEKSLEYNREASLTGKALYYTGVPLQQGTVRYTVIRREYQPPFYWWWKPAPSKENIVKTGTLQTSEDGEFSLSFTPKKQTENETFAQYDVQAEVSDQSGRPIRTTRSYTVSAQPHLFRVEFTQGFYDARKATALASLDLTDLSGHSVPGKITAKAELLKNQFPSSEKETNLPLEELYREIPAEKTVFTKEISFKTPGKQMLFLPALPEGVYRLTLSSEKAAAQSLIFLVVEKKSSLLLPEIALPQHTRYYPGTPLRVLLGAGKLPGIKWVEIYQGNQFLLKKEALGSGVEVFSFPVTETARGGLSLRWFGVGNYQFYSGQTSVEVPFYNKEITATLTPPPHVRPGEKVSWKLHAKTKAGLPVQGQASLTVYDKSLDYYAQNTLPFSLAELYPKELGIPSSSASRKKPWARSYSQVPPKEYPALNRFNFPTLNLQMQRKLYRNNSFGSAKFYARSAKVMAAGSLDTGLPETIERMASNDMSTAPAFAIAEEESSTQISSLQESIPSSEIRNDFSETAFFQSAIPLKNGTAAIQFTMPDILTTWNILGFVLTRQADFGSFTAQTITRKDFMVQLQTPRFYREGDKGMLQALVSNQTNKKLTATVELFIQQNNQSALASFGLGNTQKSLTLSAGETRAVSWEIQAPNRPELYTFTAVVRSGPLSDAEQKQLPILPAKQRLLATAHTALKTGNNELSLPQLNQIPPSDVETVVLSVNPSLALSVLNSMPNLLNTPHGDLVSTLNRFLPLAVVNQFYTAHPQLKEAVKKLPKRTGTAPSWEEEDPLRLTLLENTPWLRQARGDTPSKERLIQLFDTSSVTKHLAKASAQLIRLQNPSGAFSWFSGGPDDDYLTLYALQGFAQALAYGAPIPQEAAKKAFAYIYPRIEKQLQENKTGSEGAVSYALYAAYTLSAFPKNWAETSEARPYLQRWADYADQHARFMTALGQIYAAAVYHRLGDDVKANRYLDKVLSRMKQDPISGAYFAPEKQSWVWYRDTLTTQTTTLRTLLEIRPDAPQVEPLTQWLLFNRQVNEWNDAKAAAQAVFTLLDVMKYKGTLALPVVYQVEWNGTRKNLSFDPLDWTKDLQWVHTKNEITPNAFEARISKKGGLTDFASLSAVYQTAQAEASAEGILNIKRNYYVRRTQAGETLLFPIQELDEIKVGDELEVRLTVTSSSAFEYVLLEDPKPTGFESEQLLSGWTWQPVSSYQETRDASTRFFIHWLPAGEITFRYILRPTTAGRFQAPAAQIQSLYAPEFGAHTKTESLRISR